MSKSVRILGPVGVLVGIAALALALTSVVSAGGTTVSIGSFVAQVEHEGTVDLTVDALPDAGLGAWTVDISYNPEIAVPVQCDAGFGGICNGGYSENTIRVTGISAFGLRNEAVLATVYFACVKPGESSLALGLSVFADATAGDPQDIDTETKSGGFTCTEDPVEPTPTPTPGKGDLPGDANCSGTVDAVDATLILQLSASLINDVPCPENGDVNKDGGIDSVDATLVLQQNAGLL